MGKAHRSSIFGDKFLFQKAYKKLKSDAYYDKTKVILKKFQYLFKRYLELMDAEHLVKFNMNCIGGMTTISLYIATLNYFY